MHPEAAPQLARHTLPCRRDARKLPKKKLPLSSTTTRRLHPGHQTVAPRTVAPRGRPPSWRGTTTLPCRRDARKLPKKGLPLNPQGQTMWRNVIDVSNLTFGPLCHFPEGLLSFHGFQENQIPFRNWNFGMGYVVKPWFHFSELHKLD